MSCDRVKIKKSKICVGDMRYRVTLQTRSDKFQSLDTNVGEAFADIDTVKAAIDFLNGVEIFDGVNVVGIATHDFYIRYRADITAQEWVLLDGVRYDILATKILDSRPRGLRLRCNVRGSSSKAVNSS